MTIFAMDWKLVQLDYIKEMLNHGQKKKKDIALLLKLGILEMKKLLKH